MFSGLFLVGIYFDQSTTHYKTTSLAVFVYFSDFYIGYIYIFILRILLHCFM